VQSRYGGGIKFQAGMGFLERIEIHATTEKLAFKPVEIPAIMV
jgi:hypothetical protein